MLGALGWAAFPVYTLNYMIEQPSTERYPCTASDGIAILNTRIVFWCMRFVSQLTKGFV